MGHVFATKFGSSQGLFIKTATTGARLAVTFMVPTHFPTLSHFTVIIIY